MDVTLPATRTMHVEAGLAELFDVTSGEPLELGAMPTPLQLRSPAPKTGIEVQLVLDKDAALLPGDLEVHLAADRPVSYAVRDGLRIDSDANGTADRPFSYTPPAGTTFVYLSVVHRAHRGGPFRRRHHVEVTAQAGPHGACARPAQWPRPARSSHARGQRWPIGAGRGSQRRCAASR